MIPRVYYRAAEPVNTQNPECVRSFLPDIYLNKYIVICVVNKGCAEELYFFICKKLQLASGNNGSGKPATRYIVYSIPVEHILP